MRLRDRFPRQRTVVIAAALLASATVTVLVVTHRSSDLASTSAAGPATAIAASPVRSSYSSGSRPDTARQAVGTGPGTTTVATTASDTVAEKSASDPERASILAGWPDGSAARTDRSRTGARSSALLYVSSVQSQAVYAGAPADRSLLAVWLAPTAPPADLDQTLQELADAREVLTSGHGPVWWVVSPLAAHVVTATETRARVEVWLVRVIASGANESPGVVPAVSWTTSTVDLVWTDLVGWSVESVSDVPGPVPMAQSTAQPATSAEFVGRLAGFELVKGHS